MQQIAQNGLTKEQVLSILKAKKYPRKISFEYNLLNNKDEFKKKLTTITDCSIDFKALANIKRTANISLKEDRDINYLSDRIQPFIIFKSPIGSLKWPMGIFLLNSPTLQHQNDNIFRNIKCYDKLQILADDKIDSRLVIPKNANYVIEIIKLINSTGEMKVHIAVSDKTLSRDREFEIGTSKLKIINSLLSDINYYSLVADEQGVFRSSPYILPIDREVEFEYVNNKYGVYFDGIEEELDLFNVPNKFICAVSNAEQKPLKSIYINDNINSITSIVNRGRIVTRVDTKDDIADQITLNNYTRRIAYNASQIYGKIRFETCIMPMHSYFDTYRFKYYNKIDAIYNETNWSMAGGKMKHEARRVVKI